MKWTSPLILSGALLLFGFSLGGCKKSAPSQEPLPVSVVTIKEQTIPVTKEFIATGLAYSFVEIRARVSGFLVDFLFKEGDYVHANQLLYVIDKRPFQAALNEARATLQQKLALAIFQEKEYLRMKKLISKGVISQEQYDSTVAQARSSQADVLVAKANVETAALNLSYCSMYSPIDGKISQTQVDVGNYVDGGTTPTVLTTVIQLDPIYFLFNPSDQDYDLIRRYMGNGTLKVELSIPGDPNIYPGVLDFTNNQVDKTTSTVTLRATLANPNHILLQGLHGTIRVYLDTDPHAILIPQEAIQETQGQQYVYIINSTGHAESTNITTKGVYKNQSIVASGLKVGEQVITNNLQALRGGRAVKVE